jgi:hypothetical protein
LFYKIAKECDEAAGRAQTLATQLCNLHLQSDIKVRVMMYSTFIFYTKVVKLLAT